MKNINEWYITKASKFSLGEKKKKKKKKKKKGYQIQQPNLSARVQIGQNRNSFTLPWTSQ